MTHEMIAAGPAICVAVSAPSSQPEPITEPTDVNVRPVRPTSRRSEPCADDVSVSRGARATLTEPPPQQPWPARRSR
jgi:hypothetical protein